MRTAADYSLIRGDLLRIYQQALAAVKADRVVKQWLVGANPGPLAVIALGKAASAMMAGAEQALGKQLVEGLVVTKPGHIIAGGHGSDVSVLEAGHPLPNEASLEAGSLMLEFISRQLPDMPLLLLISGGTSSLVEVLAEGGELADLIAANRALLASGLPIDKINEIRRQYSVIKGGGLNNFLGQRPVQALLISDVPSDDPAIIGSGLLVASEQAQLEVIASIDDALQAAESAARKLGYEVQLDSNRLQGDAEEIGREFASMLLAAKPGFYIRGGETTVQLPAEPGTGGRNQHLALAAAMVIADHENVLILAAGTDGTDGPTEDAGALVDGQTLARGEIEAYDAGLALVAADAGTFLAVSGDLIQTGPTDTNVMDLLIGVKWADD